VAQTPAKVIASGSWSALARWHPGLVAAFAVGGPQSASASADIKVSIVAVSSERGMSGIRWWPS
jgi:hypothetical protein